MIFDNVICRHCDILDIYMQRFIENKSALIPICTIIYVIERNDFCMKTILRSKNVRKKNLLSSLDRIVNVCIDLMMYNVSKFSALGFEKLINLIVYTRTSTNICQAAPNFVKMCMTI